MASFASEERSAFRLLPMSRAAMRCIGLDALWFFALCARSKASTSKRSFWLFMAISCALERLPAFRTSGRRFGAAALLLLGLGAASRLVALRMVYAGWLAGMLSLFPPPPLVWASNGVEGSLAALSGFGLRLFQIIAVAVDLHQHGGLTPVGLGRLLTCLVHHKMRARRPFASALLLTYQIHTASDWLAWVG